MRRHHSKHRWGKVLVFLICHLFLLSLLVACQEEADLNPLPAEEMHLLFDWINLSSVATVDLSESTIRTTSTLVNFRICEDRAGLEVAFTSKICKPSKQVYF